MKLPPLNALKAFDAVARHGSFKLAAAELCVTVGAVSRQVAHLEAHLGVALFEGLQQRRAQLTKRGNEYHHAISGALSAIASATRSVTQDSDRRALLIKAPPTCAALWLVPRLKRFNARHPEIAIQISTAHEPPDFERDQIDGAILYGDIVAPRRSADRLFDEVLLPVMSPALAQRSPPLRQARDFCLHVLLHSMHRSLDWSQLFLQAGLDAEEVPAGLTFENAALAYRAAIEGVGVAVAQAAFVLPELNEGRLIVPLDIRVHNPVAYYFAVRNTRTSRRHVRQFGEWIAEEAADTRRESAQYGI